MHFQSTRVPLPVRFVWCKPEVLGWLKEHRWRRLHLFGSSGVNQKFLAGSSSSQPARVRTRAARIGARERQVYKQVNRRMDGVGYRWTAPEAVCYKVCIFGWAEYLYLPGSSGVNQKFSAGSKSISGGDCTCSVRVV